MFNKILKRFGYAKLKKRSYSGAGTGRLYASWSPSNYSSDAILRTTLKTLRARSRELERNNDYAKKFIRMVKTNVVGKSGIMLQCDIKKPIENNNARDPEPDVATNEEIETSFKEWSKRGNCDVTGEYSFRDIQNLAISTLARDGEILIYMVRNFDNKYAFALKLIEADHLDENYNYILSNGNTIKMGIEFDKWGKPASYYLYKKHPGDSPFGYSYGEKIRYAAKDIIHLYITQRISQSRGIPWMHAAMTRLNMLGNYEEAELTGARIAAAKGGFYTREGADEYVGDDKEGETPIQQVEPGAFEILPQGWKFDPFDPQHPTTAFKDFEKAILRGIASGVDVSYNYLANDLEGVNYSSIRAGVLDEREVWRDIQRWVIDHFMQTVYENWLYSALVSPEGLSHSIADYERLKSVKWQPRGWPWVDPKADMVAAAMAIQFGLNTSTDILGEQGKNYGETVKKLVEEAKVRKEAGLVTKLDLELLEKLKDSDSTESKMMNNILSILNSDDEKIKSNVVQLLEIFNDNGKE